MSVMERYLTVSEERVLFNAVARIDDIYAKRDYAWMQLLRQTGIRVGSCSALTVGEAEEGLATGHLPINAEHAKRGIGGTVPLNKRARKAVRDLLQIRRKMGFGQDPEQRLIMSRNGRGLSIRSYQNRMQYWRQEAGLPVDVSPHWFRHTLGVRIMANSTSSNPLGIVQRVLLHSNISSTAIYTKPSREDVENALEAAS